MDEQDYDGGAVLIGETRPSRCVSAAEIDALLASRDAAADPARAMDTRADIATFKRALAKLPERPREVLRRMSVKGNTADDVAKQLHVSVLTVDADLKQALKHCARSMRRP
jgi:RNA polymerase sigma-70 factor, ECF subfamily